MVLQSSSENAAIRKQVLVACTGACQVRYMSGCGVTRAPATSSVLHPRLLHDVQEKIAIVALGMCDAAV